MKVDEMINKSLEDLDKLMAEIKSENLSKAAGEMEKDISADAEKEGETESHEEAESDEFEAGESEEGNEEDEDVDNEENEDEYEKSLEKELTDSDSVRKALEVSEFLSDLVKGLSGVMGKQAVALNKSMGDQGKSTELLAKSFEGIAKSQAVVLETQMTMLKSIKTLSKKIQDIESQPNVRKSVSNVKALEKSFKDSAGDTDTKNEKLSKSQALTMLNMEFEKGNTSLSNDILILESTSSTDYLSASAKAILKI